MLPRTPLPALHPPHILPGAHHQPPQRIHLSRSKQLLQSVPRASARPHSRRLPPRRYPSSHGRHRLRTPPPSPSTAQWSVPCPHRRGHGGGGGATRRPSSSQPPPPPRGALPGQPSRRGWVAPAAPRHNRRRRRLCGSPPSPSTRWPPCPGPGLPHLPAVTVPLPCCSPTARSRPSRSCTRPAQTQGRNCSGGMTPRASGD